MNADLLTGFVDELYRQRIPIWILQDIRSDYMHRIDREQVANDVAYAIYAFFSMEPECNPQMIQNSYGLCRRVSRCTAIDAIKKVFRHKRALSRSRNFHVGETETLVDRASTYGNSTVDYDDFCQFHLNAMTHEQRSIAKLRIDGWTIVEISEWIGCSAKRIQRKLSRISVFLEERLRTEDGGRRTEDGGRRTEDGGRRTEEGGRRTEKGERIRKCFALAVRNSRFVFEKIADFRRNRKRFVDLSNSVRNYTWKQRGRSQSKLNLKSNRSDQMNRYMNFGCFFIVLLCVPIIACPPTPLPWDIDDPVNGSNPVYSANIACEGEAVTSANYTLKVIRTSDKKVLKTIDDTSSQCAWMEEIPEPNGGWPVPAGAATPSSLELWSGGNSYDVEPIGLKP